MRPKFSVWTFRYRNTEGKFGCKYNALLIAEVHFTAHIFRLINLEKLGDLYNCEYPVEPFS